jgi:hypothetical protein
MLSFNIGYIELEMQLGEIDRCRSIYSKYLEHMPYNVSAWKSLATLETNCGEVYLFTCVCIYIYIHEHIYIYDMSAWKALATV